MPDILDPNLYDRLERVERTVHEFGDRLVDVEKEVSGLRSALHSEAHSLHDGLGDVKTEVASVNHQLTEFAEKLGEQRGMRAVVQQWAPTLVMVMMVAGLGTLLERRISAFETSISTRMSNLELRIGVVEGPGFKLAQPVDPALHPQLDKSDRRVGAVKFVLPPDGPKEVPVKAMASGAVTEASQSKGEDGKTFWTVAITPEAGLVSHYSHLSELSDSVLKKLPVVTGQEIGIMRRASPVCLQVWVTKHGSDEAIDPRPYFQK
jgi:murein DD-endopeptidase MepM/ murein hydrolase activator NlpD